jgi:hypothetical protein
MRAFHVPVITLAAVAAPAYAAQYLEVHLATYAPVEFVVEDGDGNFVRYETDIYNTTLDAVVDVADLEADGGYFPYVPGSAVTGLSLDSSGFSAFTIEVPSDVGLTFSYNVPLNGLDPEKSFSRTFWHVGSYSADYTYSRYEILQTVGGPITSASFRSFSSDDAIANSISFSQGLYAVPEPASWAMMLGGFGIVGAAMRYRRRQAERFA